MNPDRATCHRCRRRTLWTPTRSGRQLECEGCGDTFPCRDCKHFDCISERDEQRRAGASTRAA